jgi:hypothetical protein
MSTTSSKPPFIAHLGVFKTEPGLYDYTVTVDGRDDALLEGRGLASIRQALEAGAQMTGPITALEVSYRGVTAGTFTLARLPRDAEPIAGHLVETFAAVMAG